MRNTIQKKVQVGLIGIILVLASTGCAHLNKESKETQATEPVQASVAEAKPTTSVDTTPPIEEEAQPLQSSDTTPPIEEEAQPLQRPTPFVHTVQWPQETVSIIAKWYTGEFENWKALMDTNPKLKRNRISIGSKILIPEDFLKTRESMPQEFLAKFTSKKKKKASPSTPPPEEEKEPDLIGPKEYSGR